MSTKATVAFAERFRQERLRLGSRQADVASRAGMSTISYFRFERTGRITLDRLLAVAAALGLRIDASPVTGSDVAANPAATRQRGVRQQTRPATAATKPSKDKTKPGRSRARRKAAEAGTTIEAAAPLKPAVDAKTVASVRRQYRDPIRLLIRVIVDNQLGNYTVATVVQNVMRSNRVADADKPAFVAATEAELGQLTSENCVALGLNPAQFAKWSDAWKPQLGLVGALE